MLELFAMQNIVDIYIQNQAVFLILLLIICVYPVSIIVNSILHPTIKKIVKKKNDNYLSIIERNDLIPSLKNVVIAFYFTFLANFLMKEHVAIATILYKFIHVITAAYLTITATIFILNLINVFVEIYKTKTVSRKISLGLHAQIIKIIVIVCSILVMISLILNINVSSVFKSLGAAAALLTFVFKDTVLGLVASLQLTMQDIIRVGDWITLPKYNADGDVEKITITVVVIRNFDKTITTVPTYALISSDVQNWRGMQESGGRRIKRAVNIDIHSVKKASDDLVKKLLNNIYIKDYINNAEDKSKITNIRLFREYINSYLREHKDIHKSDFTFLVRQLSPTQYGVPIEIYVFTNDTNWVRYEHIQADIFEHLISIMPEFELKAFQKII